MWVLTVGVRGGMGGGGQRGKNWDNCNSINNNKKKLSEIVVPYNNSEKYLGKGIVKT